MVPARGGARRHKSRSCFCVALMRFYGPRTRGGAGYLHYYRRLQYPGPRARGGEVVMHAHTIETEPWSPRAWGRGGLWRGRAVCTRAVPSTYSRMIDVRGEVP